VKVFLLLLAVASVAFLQICSTFGKQSVPTTHSWHGIDIVCYFTTWLLHVAVRLLYSPVSWLRQPSSQSGWMWIQ